MDNQFNQPGGMPPQGAQGGWTPTEPAGGTPYAGQGFVPNPYDAMPQGGYAPQQPYQQNPYETMGQGGYAPQQPYQQNPYDAMGQGGYAPQQPVNPYDAMGQGGYPPQQPAYGTVQQPYMDPGAMQQPYSDAGYEHRFGPQAQQGAFQQAPMHGQPFAGAAGAQAPSRKKRLSPSDIALIVVALVAVVIFAGWYLISNYAPQVAPYGEVTVGSLSAIHSGNVLVVRNEIPYDAEAVNSIVYEAGEGSRVTNNSVICYIYSTGYSASALRLMQEYRDDIRKFQMELVENSTIYDVKSDSHNKAVLNLAKQVRSYMAGEEGSLENIENQLTQAVAERQTYFDQKYASDQNFSRLKDNERSQNQRISSWTLPCKATTDALVSFYSDGYEYAINGSNYRSFDPQAVRQMISGVKPANAAPAKGHTTLYRMVKDNEWYALFLSDDTDWNPVNGETYQLQLERFGDTPVTATVVDFTKAGGELLVRLRIVGSVEQVMYLRTCSAVLSESVTTLQVNERAITQENGRTGVYVKEGSVESFIQVNVIHTVDGYAYIQSAEPGLLFEGMQVRLFN